MIQPNAPSLSTSLSASAAAPVGLPGEGAAQGAPEGGFAQVLEDFGTVPASCTDLPLTAASPRTPSNGALPSATTAGAPPSQYPAGTPAASGKSPAPDGNILPLAAARLPSAQPGSARIPGSDESIDESLDALETDTGETSLEDAETATLPDIVTFSPAFLAALQFTLPVPPEAGETGAVAGRRAELTDAASQAATDPVQPATATLAYLPSLTRRDPTRAPAGTAEFASTGATATNSEFQASAAITTRPADATSLPASAQINATLAQLRFAPSAPQAAAANDAAPLPTTDTAKVAPVSATVPISMSVSGPAYGPAAVSAAEIPANAPTAPAAPVPSTRALLATNSAAPAAPPARSATSPLQAKPQATPHWAESEPAPSENTTEATSETALSAARGTDRPQLAHALAHTAVDPIPGAASRIAGTAAPAPTGETPQDFATLVNRLHEAREGQGAGVVRTTLVHAQFGAVSLQFKPDDSGMSVSLASADPDFAPSVQAAAASALTAGSGQQGETGREGQFGSSPHSGAQQHNSSHTNAGSDGRSFSQANSQAGGEANDGTGANGARGARPGLADDRANATESAQASTSRDGADARGGIYA